MAETPPVSVEEAASVRTAPQGVSPAASPDGQGDQSSGGGSSPAIPPGVGAVTRSMKPRGGGVRIKQHAKRSTGGKAPRKQLAKAAARVVNAQLARRRVSKKKYYVDKIVDRTSDESGVWYLVRYMKGEERWTPKESLAEDGFAKEMALVDRWVDKYQDKMTFDRFYNSVSSNSLMTASDDGDCVLQAVRAALECSGYGDRATTESWKEFLAANNIADGEGVGIKKAAAYARSLGKINPVFEIHAAKLRVALMSSVRSLVEIFEHQLPRGVYLVDCMVSGGKRHCMALRVDERDEDFQPHFVWDEGEWIGLREADVFTGQVNGVYAFELLRVPRSASDQDDDDEEDDIIGDLDDEDDDEDGNGDEDDDEEEDEDEDDDEEDDEEGDEDEDGEESVRESGGVEGKRGSEADDTEDSAEEEKEGGGDDAESDEDSGSASIAADRCQDDQEEEELEQPNAVVEQEEETKQEDVSPQQRRGKKRKRSAEAQRRKRQRRRERRRGETAEI